MTNINQSSEIIVLGAGASGITTALTLQLLGFETRVIGAKLFHTAEQSETNDALFASRYPAASIIPHSIRNERMDVLYQDSSHIFQQLYDNGLKMLRKNIHYEWFRFPVSKPEYSEWMEHFSFINETDADLTKSVFDSKAARSIHGWSFYCFFVDWPRYIHRLYEWYEQCGGEIEQKRVSSYDIKSFKTACIVNCTGAYSRKLFKDPEDFCYLMGKTLVIEDAPDPVQFDSVISYNYTPGSEIYSHSSGTPVDLYCYPRKSGWVLGGSRLHGHLDDKGRWTGERWTGRMTTIDQQQVPAPIYEINRDLIRNLYHFDISDHTLRAKSGYRFMRDSKTNGLRLDKSREYGHHIFHNYGHGGSGVTLSWGCALQIARMIRNYKRPTEKSTPALQDHVLAQLYESLRRLF